MSVVPLRDILPFAGPPAHIYHYKTFTIMVWNKNLLADLGSPPSSVPGNIPETGPELTPRWRRLMDGGVARARCDPVAMLSASEVESFVADGYVAIPGRGARRCRAGLPGDDLVRASPGTG